MSELEFTGLNDLQDDEIEVWRNCSMTEKP